jgi:hypothetical protein
MHIQSYMSSAMPWARRSLIILAACALGPLFATFAHADAVTDWNETAIRAADRAKNPALTADPTWEPLLNTPAHPDYPSGHATYSGAAAEVLKAILGDDRVDVSFVSTGVTRTYTSFSQLDREIIDARVWGGIHFRTTDEDSSALGHKIGEYAVKTWLRPVSPNVGLR